MVIGTSIGGATALDFALNHPEDVAALILIDAQVCLEDNDKACSAVCQWVFDCSFNCGQFSAAISNVQQ